MKPVWTSKSSYSRRYGPVNSEIWTKVTSSINHSAICSILTTFGPRFLSLSKSKKDRKNIQIFFQKIRKNQSCRQSLEKRRGENGKFVSLIFRKLASILFCCFLALFRNFEVLRTLVSPATEGPEIRPLPHQFEPVSKREKTQPRRMKPVWTSKSTYSRSYGPVISCPTTQKSAFANLRYHL